jgi:hypothetical protein
LKSAKINSDSPIPNKITPTFSWDNDRSDICSTPEIINQLCQELTLDLENNDYDSICKSGEELGSYLKAFLSKLPNEGLKDEKSWISALMISLSKQLKASKIDEMKLIVKGLSDALNELETKIKSEDISLSKFDKKLQKSRIEANEHYPSPHISPTTTSLSSPIAGSSRYPQISPISSIAGSPTSSDLLLDRNGKVKLAKIGGLLTYLKDIERTGNIFLF